MSWWKKKYDKESICGITHSRLRSGTDRNGQTYSIFLPCGHGFYRSPLAQWVLSTVPRNPTCPLCRTEFNLDLVFLKSKQEIKKQSFETISN